MRKLGLALFVAAGAAGVLPAASRLELYRAARGGAVDAQLALATMYLTGEGAPRDAAKAWPWLEKAAAAGLAEAQFQLSRLHHSGEGAPEDRGAMVRWLKAAATQGHTAAAFDLGACYKLGSGVAVDHAEGARWLRQAAEGGHAKAQHQLGVAHYTGSGVAKDLERAVYWVRRAADQGHPPALTDLKVLAQRGQDTPVPAEPGARFAWLRSRAPQGVARLKQALAVCYADGVGTTRDDAAALRWFRDAAEAGSTEAMLDLGVRYLTGEGGVGQDEAAGKRWLRKAAAQGHSQAKRLLRAVAPPPRPKTARPAPPPRKTFSQHMDDVWGDIERRQQRRDAYISSQRRAFNDYLDRTNSQFAWRYR